MYCSKCGKEVLPNDQFCVYCGNKLYTKKVMIDNSASVESLQKRGMMLLEDGDFSSAEDYFNRILSLEPENYYGFLGIQMAKYKLKSEEEFFNYYKNLYSQEYSENINACDEDTQHIEDMISTYSIPFYLEKDKIIEKYAFGRGLRVLLPVRKNQKKQIEDEFINDTNLSRIRKYANRTNKKKINAIFKEYDKRINEAKTNDEKAIEAVKDAYQEHIEKTDSLIKQLHDQALIDRENDYQHSIDIYNNSSDLIELNKAYELFEMDGDYKQSNEYALETKAKITEIENIIASRRKQRRLTIIVSVCALIFVILAGILFYRNSIVPNTKYNNALSLVEQGQYDQAISIFNDLGDYKDSKDQFIETRYLKGCSLLNGGYYSEAISIFEKLGDYKDSFTNMQEATYMTALRFKQQKRYDEAIAVFNTIIDYKDASEQITLTEQDKKNDSITLINLKGRSLVDAEKYLKTNDLKYTVLEKESQSDKAGLILSMSPETGTVLLKGDMVTITVSKGLEKYETYIGDGNNKALYQVNIITKGNIYKRRHPHIDPSNKTEDQAKPGEAYNVYETILNEGYTWIRADNNEWIAIENEWVERDSNCTHRNGDFTIRKAWINDVGGSGVYDKPTENTTVRQWVDSLPHGSEVTIYYKFYNGSHYWYKIGANRWVKDLRGEKVKFYYNY